jgi:hypothetical protein
MGFRDMKPRTGACRFNKTTAEKPAVQSEKKLTTGNASIRREDVHHPREHREGSAGKSRLRVKTLSH